MHSCPEIKVPLVGPSGTTLILIFPRFIVEWQEHEMMPLTAERERYGKNPACGGSGHLLIESRYTKCDKEIRINIIPPLK